MLKLKDKNKKIIIKTHTEWKKSLYRVMNTEGIFLKLYQFDMKTVAFPTATAHWSVSHKLDHRTTNLLKSGEIQNSVWKYSKARIDMKQYGFSNHCISAIMTF